MQSSKRPAHDILNQATVVGSGNVCDSPSPQIHPFHASTFRNLAVVDTFT